MYINHVIKTSHGTSLWCNLVIVAQISLEMVVTKKKNDASIYRIKGNEI